MGHTPVRDHLVLRATFYTPNTTAAMRTFQDLRWDHNTRFKLYTNEGRYAKVKA